MPMAVAKAAMVLKTARIMAEFRIDLAARNLSWLMTWYVELLLEACSRLLDDVLDMLMFMA